MIMQRLYREKGENQMHTYTLTGDLPEHVQAKINALNLSEVRFLNVCSVAPLLIIHLFNMLFVCFFKTRYKESWTKLRDAGYKLRLDAIPFQAARSSREILSDVRANLLYLVSLYIYQCKVIERYCFSILAKIQRAV